MFLIAASSPANCAICSYNGNFNSAAPALQTAIETPKIALAPNLLLLPVPSSFFKKSSTCFCFVTEISLLINSGPKISLTFSTACKTPLPSHFDLSPSFNSTASFEPVDAPDGTIERKVPRFVVKSTSTVGLPRLS